MLAYMLCKSVKIKIAVKRYHVKIVGTGMLKHTPHHPHIIMNVGINKSVAKKLHKFNAVCKAVLVSAIPTKAHLRHVRIQLHCPGDGIQSTLIFKGYLDTRPDSRIDQSVPARATCIVDGRRGEPLA